MKKISARDSSNKLVAPPTAENEIAYSTHYFRFPSFNRCAVKRFGTHRTVARTLDVLATKPLPCNITAPVHESCAKPLRTAVVCTRDSAVSCVAPRTELNSEIDLTCTRPVSCAHQDVRENSLVTIAQVDTRATSRDAREYISDRTPRSRHLILNLLSSLLYRHRITRLISRDYSFPMSALLDRFDAAEIIALASVDAISVEDARNQLQSHIAVDVMIEGFDQRFTDTIIAEGCATPRLFLERTLARLPPTLAGVDSAAMIACDETPVRCEKQSSKGTLSVALVFCFRIRSYYAARQVVAMFNRRFDWRPIAERYSVCYVPIPHRRSSATAAQLSADASSSQTPNPLRLSNPSCQARVPPLDHSSRFPLCAPRLQARLLSYSVSRSLAVHFSRSSHRRKLTPRLTPVIRGLHCRSRIYSRSGRLT